MAFVAAAVQNLGWHRPSDVIGATLLACISYLIATHLLPTATQPAPALGLAPVLAVGTVGAVLGAGRSGYFPEAIVAAIVGLLCALILWSTVAQGSRTAVVAVQLPFIVSTIGIDYWRKHSAVTVDNSRPEPALITGPGTAGKGVTIGKPGAKTNIDFYLGFGCGRCAEFEQASDSTLDSMLDNGATTITYWPVVAPESDQRLPSLFALAAANGKAHGFLHAFYGDFEKAWTDSQLAELGEKLGRETRWTEPIRRRVMVGWVTCKETSFPSSGRFRTAGQIQDRIRSQPRRWPSVISWTRWLSSTKA